MHNTSTGVRFALRLVAFALAAFGFTLGARAATKVMGMNGYEVLQLDPSDYTLLAVPLDSNHTDPRFTPNVVEYTGIPGPYSAFAAATGAVGFDGYTSSPDAAGTYPLKQFSFVGGVDTGPTNAVNCEFDFFDTSSNFVNGATIALNQLGAFIWTITINDPNSFMIPGSGILQDTIAPTNTGRWFLTTTAPTVGSNPVTFGTGSQLSPQRNNAFELVSAPEPTSLGVLGFGALLTFARRRRA